MSGDWNYIDLEKPENYRKFIREALKYADCIGLSYSSDYSAFLGSDCYNILSESIIRHEYSDRGELVLYFKIDHTVIDWLRSKKDIYDFLPSLDDDEYLWDLCLYKDGRMIFWSITREYQTGISDELWENIKEKFN